MIRTMTGSLVAFTLMTSATLAADVTKLGNFGNWSGYSYKESGNKTCFMSANPAKTEISNPKATRSNPQIFITHRAGEKSRDVVSVYLGYKATDTVTVDIDGKSYKMIADGETAWTKSETEDKSLAAALRKGSKATIRATSAKGTKTTDTYTLKSSNDAYKAIGTACGFK